MLLLYLFFSGLRLRFKLKVSLDRLSLFLSVTLIPLFKPIWKLFLILSLGLLSLYNLEDDLPLALLSDGTSKKSACFISNSWFFSNLFCFCSLINSSFFLLISILTRFSILISTWQYFSWSLNSCTNRLSSSTLSGRDYSAEFGLTKILLNLLEWPGWLIIKFVLFCPFPSLISFSASSMSSIRSFSYLTVSLR